MSVCSAAGETLCGRWFSWRKHLKKMCCFLWFQVSEWVGSLQLLGDPPDKQPSPVTAQQGTGHTAPAVEDLPRGRRGGSWRLGIRRRSRQDYSVCMCAMMDSRGILVFLALAVTATVAQGRCLCHDGPRWVSMPLSLFASLVSLGLSHYVYIYCQKDAIT